MDNTENIISSANTEGKKLAFIFTNVKMLVNKYYVNEKISIMLCHVHDPLMHVVPSGCIS